MSAIIISTFPGCGKTYLYEHQDDFNYKIIDLESSKFKGMQNWEMKYVDCIQCIIEEFDFILISKQDNVLLELIKRNIPFVIVAPHNSDKLSVRERNLIKQQWFGRFLLRNNSHIANLDVWLKKVNNYYDEWTKEENLIKFHPQKYYPLKENQYLSDIIQQIKN